MTSGEFREFLIVMKEFNIKKAKVGDLEIEFEQALVTKEVQNVIRETSNLQVETPENDPIKHKVEQVASLLKLSDNELIDQLFPDKTEEESA